ncbi:fluoride efflux transporter CrcB [Aquisalimonas lutea]|uniref:fluoride efflux transporter CrcB n=1 Tax=Aquisalimonas lutea TaxID=1327750 RepID=UPI0025B5B3BC|nr:fluoride efflux transporter CrcB [Aquisalimonas lutea]MDN3517939.1 fluoride efflux transporter CrcB [Aquisalimonas lutea]
MRSGDTLMVGLGSAAGAVLRQLVADAYGPATADAMLPWDTLTVNVVGCLLIGWLAASSRPGGRVPLPRARVLLLTSGFCGGFTTFSLFSLESVTRLYAGDVVSMLAYAGATVILCLAGVWTGDRLAQRTRPRHHR